MKLFYVKLWIYEPSSTHFIVVLAEDMVKCIAKVKEHYKDLSDNKVPEVTKVEEIVYSDNKYKDLMIL